MSEDLSRLHRILKDSTRVNILTTLEKKDSLAYSELLTLSGISNTGRLNYHLKILDDLVSKNSETGEYSLSEKGRLAVEFLRKFQAASGGSEFSTIQGLKIPKTPFEKSGRILQGLLCLEIVLIVFVNLYAYASLPTTISLHYEFNGQMLSSGPKYIFLLFSGLFNIPQAIFLLLSIGRRSVASTPITATNFPSFSTRLQKINYERRGYWVNKYFSMLLAFGSVIGFVLLLLNLGIYESAISASSLSTLWIEGIIAVVVIAVIGLLVYMRNYVRQLKRDVG